MTFKQLLSFLLFIVSGVIVVQQLNKQKTWWWVCLFWLIKLAKNAVEYAEMMVTY